MVSARDSRPRTRQVDRPSPFERPGAVPRSFRRKSSWLTSTSIGARPPHRTTRLAWRNASHNAARSPICGGRARGTQKSFKNRCRVTADGQSSIGIQAMRVRLGPGQSGGSAGRRRLSPALRHTSGQIEGDMRNSTSLAWRQVITGALIALGLAGAIAHIGNEQATKSAAAPAADSRDQNASASRSHRPAGRHNRQDLAADEHNG